MLKSILCCEAGVHQISYLVDPFLQAPIVKDFKIDLDNKSYDVKFQTFLKQDHHANTAVTISEWMNPFKGHIVPHKILKCLYKQRTWNLSHSRHFRPLLKWSSCLFMAVDSCQLFIFLYPPRYNWASFKILTVLPLLSQKGCVYTK